MQSLLLQARFIQPHVLLSDYLLNNFISLTVSMADETPTLVVDLPNQQVVGVLAQWCGALGFWMGLSATTVFELIQLLCDFFPTRRSCRQSKKKVKVSITDVNLVSIDLSVMYRVRQKN